MKNSLDAKQIQSLFEFCETKFIQHYDVQEELVDHLACAIENKLEENNDLDFKQARFLVYQEFGTEGFNKIRIAKEKTIRHKYSGILRKYIGEYYRMPKIITTIIGSMLLFIAFRITNNSNLFSILLFIMYFCVMVFYFAYYVPKYLRIKILDGKSFLLHAHFKQIKMMVLSFGFFPFHILNLANVFHITILNRPILELITSLTIVFFAILSYGYAVYLPKRIAIDFKHEYPQFVIG